MGAIHFTKALLQSNLKATDTLLANLTKNGSDSVNFLRRVDGIVKGWKAAIEMTLTAVRNTSAVAQHLDAAGSSIPDPCAPQREYKDQLNGHIPAEDRQKVADRILRITSDLAVCRYEIQRAIIALDAAITDGEPDTMVAEE